MNELYTRKRIAIRRRGKRERSRKASRRKGLAKMTRWVVGMLSGVWYLTVKAIVAALLEKRGG